MHTNKLKPWSKLTALAMCSAIIFSSCTKEEDDPTSPDIPPSETMVMNFESFNSDSNSEKGAKTAADKSNHAAAAVTVGFWSLVVGVQTIVPVLAFNESFNHDAVYDSDTKEWVRSYNFGAFDAHEAALHASLDGNDVVWKMYIDLSDKPEVLWFEGVSSLTGGNGTWRLYKDADNPVPYLDIAWTKNTDGADLKYTYLIDDVHEGSTITYALDETAELDASFEIFGAEKNETVNVDWSRTNKNGRIKAPGHFEDDAYHCWDNSFINADCE